MSDFAWLDGYLRQKPGTVWDYKPEWGWDRYRIAQRLYAAICLPGPVYAREYAGHPLLTLKCDPLESELLRAACPDILPGFYTDKRPGSPSVWTAGWSESASCACAMRPTTWYSPG